MTITTVPVVRRPTRPHPYHVRSIAYPAFSRWVVLVSAVSLWAVVDDADTVEPVARKMLERCGAGPRFGLLVVRECSGESDPEQFGARFSSAGLYRWYPPARQTGDRP